MDNRTQLQKLNVKDLNGWDMWREWNSRMVKRVFEGHPGVRRKIGRDKKRWLDDNEEDLRLMKVKRWRKNASEREV
jgi:hypothetical protein